MSYIISVYGERAFKKFLLPAINNADYNAILYREVFGLAQDLSLRMENTDLNWSFQKSEDYNLKKNGTEYFGQTLQANDIIQLQTKQNEKLTILVHQIDTPFEVYKKYSLRNLRKVTIGKESGNHICYDYFGLVSKNHAVLEMTEKGCRIRDTSANGVFVNSIRIVGTKELCFGDSIHILGLQIIYLGDLIAVEQQSASVKVDYFVLKEISGEELNYFTKKERQQENAEELYHRTPRNIEKLDCEPVEIEEPPAAGQKKKQSILMAIGPSFTMAVPMLLGSVLSAYSYSSSGRSGLFMYAGMVTAVASALIGGLWAVLNIRSAKKAQRMDEEERRNAYVGYLEKMMFNVKEKYEKNTQILHTRYPSAEICAGYGHDCTGLWNRNPHHEDFLYQRLGLGRIAFQAPIQIPKERFRVQKDELALKPKDIKVAYETLKDVPVGVDFMEHSLVGIIGGEHKAGALAIARNLLIQIAANNCYTDVRIGVIYNRENSHEADCLSCAKWLPHIWSADRKIRYIAGTAEDAADVFYELAGILRERRR